MSVVMVEEEVAAAEKRTQVRLLYRIEKAASGSTEGSRTTVCQCLTNEEAVATLVANMEDHNPIATLGHNIYSYDNRVLHKFAEPGLRDIFIERSGLASTILNFSPQRGSLASTSSVASMGNSDSADKP